MIEAVSGSKVTGRVLDETEGAGDGANDMNWPKSAGINREGRDQCQITLQNAHVSNADQGG